MPLNARAGRERGMTLVEVMVAVAIGGIVIALLASVMDSTLRAYADGRAAMSLEQTRFMIRSTLDCQATVAAMPSPCPPRRAVTLLGAGRVLVAGAPATSVYGDLELRAVCTGRTREFRIEAKRLTETTFQALFNTDMVCP